MNVDPHYQLQKCRSITLVSGNINDSKAFLAGTSSNLSGVVEIDEFAVFPLPYLRKFQK